MVLPLIIFGLSAFSQENKEIKKAPLFTYKCLDSVLTNKDKSVVQLFGDANFKTDLLEITHADKIVFNNTTKEVFVIGKFDFLMDGKIRVKDGSKNKTLRYKIGDHTAYIE